MPAGEKTIYLTLLIAVVIVAVFLVFFVITIMKYQKKYRTLYRQLLRAEIQSAEKERRSIAADLHDDFGQVLSFIRIQVNHMLTPGGLHPERVQQVTSSIDDMLIRMRNMGESLAPDILSRKSFDRAAEQLLNRIGQLGVIKITQDLQGGDALMGYERSIHLFRILQEIVNNTLKHASATRLWVHTHIKGKKYFLTTKDDGKGFDHQKLDEMKAGSGLRNIHNRVELLEGDIFFDTAPDQGVKFEIIIPLAYAKR